MHGVRSVSGAHCEVRTPWHMLPTPERDLSTISIRPNVTLTIWCCSGSGLVQLRWFLAPPFGVCIQCSAPAWARTLTDLRPEVKRKTRCDEENPSQQQLEYWQQHMQHVSSWASGAIISDRQTNTWHWFDLSICTLEWEDCRRNHRATEILQWIIKWVCSSQAQLLIIYSKTWEAGSGRD